MFAISGKNVISKAYNFIHLEAEFYITFGYRKDLEPYMREKIALNGKNTAIT